MKIRSITPLWGVLEQLACAEAWKRDRPKLHKKRASRKECYIAGYRAATAAAAKQRERDRGQLEV